MSTRFLDDAESTGRQIRPATLTFLPSALVYTFNVTGRGILFFPTLEFVSQAHDFQAPAETSKPSSFLKSGPVDAVTCKFPLTVFAEAHSLHLEGRGIFGGKPLELGSRAAGHAASIEDVDDTSVPARTVPIKHRPARAYPWGGRQDESGYTGRVTDFET